MVVVVVVVVVRVLVRVLACVLVCMCCGGEGGAKEVSGLWR